MDGSRALSGIRVLDLTDGMPALSDVLLELGASVFRVGLVGEGGSSDAEAIPDWPPPSAAAPVALDLTCGPDRDALLALVRDADVLLESWKPGFARMLGFGYEDMSAVNPRLVYVSVVAEATDTRVVTGIIGAVEAARATGAGTRLSPGARDEVGDPR